MGDAHVAVMDLAAEERAGAAAAAGGGEIACGFADDGSLGFTKTLLAGLLHDDTISSASPSPLPLPSSAFPSLAFMSDSLASPISQSPVFKSLSQGAGGCVTCGRGAEGRTLHRLKHDGLVRHHCSSCILFYNKGMYCSLCFQVYRDASQLGDPALWLTCCKCQRLSHVECVRSHWSSADSLDFSSFTCHDCSNPSLRREASASQLMEGLSPAEAGESPTLASPEALSPSHKKLRLTYDPQDKTEVSDLADAIPGHIAACRSNELGLESNHVSAIFSVLDQEALAAANIVAALAANEAKDAKARAIATAAAAVKAAARAKVALDTAYRAGREEARSRAEASKNLGAMAGPSTVQGTGANMLERSKLETVAGRDDHTGQLTRLPANEEELARQLGSPRSPRTAVPSHKRRTLSAIAASEASRAMPSSAVALQHGVVSFKQQQVRPQLGSSNEVRQHESLNSVQEVADQSHEESVQHVAPFTGSQGFVASASQASILEGAPLVGTLSSCSSTLPGNATPGISQGNLVGNGSCSDLLPGNNTLGTPQGTFSENGLMGVHRGDFAADGSDRLPNSITNNSITDTFGFLGKSSDQSDGKELKGKPSDTGEASTDDLVDLGILLPEAFEKEDMLSDGLVVVEGGQVSHGISAGNDLVSEKTRDVMSGDAASEIMKPEKDEGLGVMNHQHSSPAVTTMGSEQLNGSKLTGEQGKTVYDEGVALANKTFVQKNQRPIVLHMSVSNHGEMPIPYGMTKTSVGPACSVPLQTQTLTGVPTGQHS